MLPTASCLDLIFWWTLQSRHLSCSVILSYLCKALYHFLERFSFFLLQWCFSVFPLLGGSIFLVTFSQLFFHLLPIPFFLPSFFLPRSLSCNWVFSRSCTSSFLLIFEWVKLPTTPNPCFETGVHSGWESGGTRSSFLFTVQRFLTQGGRFENV